MVSLTASTEPILSVVIPTFNRQPQLHRVLVALSEQNIPEPFEVVVVSDGSTDGTMEYLSGPLVPLPVIAAEQTNAGPAQARNRGVDLASGDIIMFIDDDLVPSPQLLREHLAAHRRLGERAVVIGPMLDPVDFELSPWTKWEQAMLHKQYAAMAAGKWAPTARQFYTANASLRRELLAAVGGFDPAFRRMEDVELAYRLDDSGVDWDFAPNAEGYHYAVRSYDSWLDIGYAYGRNDVVFGRNQERGRVLEVISLEYRSRNPLLRVVIGFTVPRPKASMQLRRVVRRFATSQVAKRSDRVARAALSLAYNDAYYRGVADELGGIAQFRALLKVRR